MPHRRPFDGNERNVPDMLNDMENVLMPRAYNGADVPADITADFQMTMDNANGCMLDCMAAVTLTADASATVDGFSCVVNAFNGLVTLTLPFKDNTASKTIATGNSALISCDGLKWRIFRGAAT
jgi:hypothetical protein